VIADHVFRAPALMLQKNERFIALLPDIDLLGDTNRIIKTAADLQVETVDEPFISYGLMNWERKREHVYYTFTDTLPAQAADTAFIFGYTLYFNAAATKNQGYRDIVRYQWENVGRDNLLALRSPQSEPFDRYIHKAWQEFLPDVILDATYNNNRLLYYGRVA
jgi:hypothetical protein